MTKVDGGLYRLKLGDDPQAVAIDVYGSMNKYTDLMRLNSQEWLPGAQVVVGGKKGRVTVLDDNESIEDMLRRMFPNQPVHIFKELYNKWNANGLYTEPGDIVFVPER